MDVEIACTVNGRPRAVRTDGRRPLLDVLREDLGLCGTKYGCGEGHCGACAVLVDGRRAFSCRMPAQEAAGKQIVTIEGLSSDGNLHPVQEAFLREQAFQCGFCTPGMIVSTVALLAENANPTEPEIRQWLNGHLCRCCGYERILQAVRTAANAQPGGDVDM